MRNTQGFALRLLAPALVVLSLAACMTGGGGGPTQERQGLSIAAPIDGQTVAGTVAVAASGVGSSVGEVEFRLGDHVVVSNADGVAFLDTRGVADGEHELVATAAVAGRSLSDSVTIAVRNDLPSSASVGAEGGALRSASGSIATILPGAVGPGTELSVEDTTETQILSRFGIDYSAMGVTFLGSLTIDGPAGSPSLPLQVDLAGWAEAVQPGQKVVMFATGPDADGDGVGELMFAADALATPAGSIVTSPVPRSEVDGFVSEVGTTARQTVGRLQAARSGRPGEIVTIVGRGFNPAGTLSNVVRFGATTEVLASVRTVGTASFNPEMELSFALPALSPDPGLVRVHNLTTGFATDPLELEIRSLGSGSETAWDGLVEQVRLAVEYATGEDPGLSAMAEPWLQLLDSHSSTVTAAMASNSGLVTAGNRSALEAVGTVADEDDERLLLRHALVLDAVAASTEELADAAANLATLLAVGVVRQGEAGGASLARAGSGGGISPTQSGGSGCSGTGSTPTAGVVFGTPTGMGAAPPGSCASGSGAGGGGGSGPSVLTSRIGEPGFDPATATLRPGTFRPVAGAIVSLQRPGGGRLSPFTAITDATGYFMLPFVPPGEPFRVVALDPATGNTATFDGVAGGINELTPVQLIFTAPSGPEPGSPAASFEIRPEPRGTLPGSWFYEFDGSSSSDSDGEIEQHVWNFGSLSASVEWTSSIWRGYGRNGTYDISLVVVDDEGNMGVTSRQLSIDDLPYDYWGLPPEQVNVSADGVPSDEEARSGFSMSTDGRYVTFATVADNLVSGDVNGATDIYLKDMEAGEVELVSGGQEGKEAWTSVAMSSDGRYVAYTEEDSPAHGTGPNRIVIIDRQLGTRQEITNDAGHHRNSVEALSGDGQILLYSASTLNVSERPAWAVDLETGEQMQLGLLLDGTSYASRVFAVGLSANGRYAAFRSSDEQIIEGDNNGLGDLFVTDLATGTTARASETASGEGADARSEAWGQVVSADGRYVVFWSAATNLVPGLEGDVEHIFLKDLETGAVELVDVNVAGEPADNDSVLPSISGDGRYVAFGSYAENLTPLMDTFEHCFFGCPNGFSYVKDRATGRVALVTMGMEDTTPNDWDQIEPIISGNGEFVSFYSWATNLVPGADTTADRLDYYRARNPLWE